MLIFDKNFLGNIQEKKARNKSLDNSKTIPLSLQPI
jgi:hypothetical protein